MASTFAGTRRSPTSSQTTSISLFPMFTARALPRTILSRSTLLTRRTVSTLPPPPPPSPSSAVSARPSRLRSFALTSASLVFAGYAMIASQNQATLMLEEAQGITRAAPTSFSTTTSASSKSTSDDAPSSTPPATSISPEDLANLDADDEPASASSSGANSAAYNEETGEINWDCPCLGGMAHGPCGDQFRASFSCFVHSEEEPKGIECVESFKAMQSCFREYPELYGGDDIEDDDEFDEAHPPPSDLHASAGDVNREDLVAQAEKALASDAGEAEGSKAAKNAEDGGLQEAKERDVGLFPPEHIGSKTDEANLV